MCNQVGGNDSLIFDGSSFALNAQGEYEVVLEDTTRLRLSRRHRQRLQDRLGLR